MNVPFEHVKKANERAEMPRRAIAHQRGDTALPQHRMPPTIGDLGLLEMLAELGKASWSGPGLQGN